MKITFKRTHNEYIVTVNGRYFSFETSLDAWKFIFELKGIAA